MVFLKRKVSHQSIQALLYVYIIQIKLAMSIHVSMSCHSNSKWNTKRLRFSFFFLNLALKMQMCLRGSLLPTYLESVKSPSAKNSIAAIAKKKRHKTFFSV